MISNGMEPQKKSNGALIGSIIIIIILIAGGIYIWQSKVQKVIDDKIQSENVAPANDEGLNDLEQDINGANTNVDVDVNNVE